MRHAPLVGLALLFTACNNNYYGVDTSTGDDTGADTGDDTGTDTEDSDTQASTDCHAADPLAITGWTRTYSVSWEGKAGTEVHSGQGADYDSRGNSAYVVKVDLTTEDGDTLTTREFRSCNAGGGADWLESRVEGTATFDLFGDFGGDFGDFADFLALLTELLGSSGGSGTSTGMPVNYRKLPTPGVPYLADLAGLTAGSPIAYDYDLMTSGQTADMMTIPNCSSNGGDLDSTCVGIDGTLQPLGLASVPEGAFAGQQAYRIVDTRTERWSEASSAGNTGLPDLGQLFPMPGFGSTTDQELISELYYKPGVGLVFERTKYASAAADDWLIVRTLTSYTGLTPE